MIAYVVKNNIDDRVIDRAVRNLEQGNIIAMPTDTSWVLACSFKSKEGINKLRKLSGERDERHFTLMCSNISQFENFCSINNKRFRLINKYTPGPYVFIIKTLPGTNKVLNLKRSELGVRIPCNPIPLAIINALGAPLYSVTAKRTMPNLPEFTDDLEDDDDDGSLPPIPEELLFESGWELEEINGVSLILDSGEELVRHFSTVLDLTGEDAAVMRSGAGAFPL